MKLWDDFVDIVDIQFKYLESFGFKKVSAEIPFVKYESSSFRISIFWEYGGRYELDLKIEPLTNKSPSVHSFGLGILAQLHNQKDHNRFEWLLVNTKEKIEFGVHELAELLLKYGDKILKGELEVIKQIEKLEKKASKKYS
jgi:hypothetical protein